MYVYNAINDSCFVFHQAHTLQCYVVAAWFGPMPVILKKCECDAKYLCGCFNIRILTFTMGEVNVDCQNQFVLTYCTWSGDSHMVTDEDLAMFPYEVKTSSIIKIHLHHPSSSLYACSPKISGATKKSKMLAQFQCSQMYKFLPQDFIRILVAVKFHWRQAVLSCFLGSLLLEPGLMLKLAAEVPRIQMWRREGGRKEERLRYRLT